jgi:aminotransferase
MATVMLALIDPGDEVIVHEPCYENYGPDAILAGGTPVYLTLEAPDYRLEREALEAVITPRTRAIVLNTPNNPSGRVFDREEMQMVAELCQEHDILAITDEIYEHIVYEGEHVAMATLPGMADRTVVVSGVSKTYSVTGWRIGTIVSPPELTTAIKKVHDFLTVGAPAPLQEACAIGINELGDDFYRDLIEEYRERRDVLVPGLLEAGFKCAMPQGAYYIMADFSALSDEDDFSFSHRLSKEAGVAPVPGSGYYSREGDGRNLIRFVFCKRLDTLREVSERLRDFASRV